MREAGALLRIFLQVGDGITQFLRLWLGGKDFRRGKLLPGLLACLLPKFDLGLGRKQRARFRDGNFLVLTDFVVAL